jgi:DNA-binding LacI/PurR family transcriptional regulator
MTRPTIYTIAEHLGVSPSTVSRAFSRPEKVSPAVRERVMATAAALGYEPYTPARQLATGRNNLLGVLMQDVTNPFIPPLLRAIRVAARAQGIEVMFIDTDEAPTSEERLIRQVKNQVDAFIMASPRSDPEALLDAIGEKPAVCINRTLPGLPATYCDDDDALFAAVGHLKMLGHGHVALLEGPADSWVARRRSSASREASDHLGVKLTSIGHYPASFEGGSQAAPALARSGATAVLSFDDVTACGLIAGLHVIGLRVPADFSLIGCDDVALAAMVTPQLTTLTAPVQELGATAVELVNARIRKPGTPPLVVPIRSTLTVRGTTAARS